MKVQEAVAVYGVETISTKDLLACIIGDEKKAAKICNNNNEVFKMLNRTVDELKALGLTLNQAVKVSACMELLKRASHTCEKVHLGNPKKAAAYLMPKLRYMEKEVFMVLALNTKNRVIASEVVSVGTLTGSLVHPREVYEVAITHKAAAIVVAHNHPSGMENPSREDRELTTMLHSAGNTMEIPLLDHIIIGDGTYFSFQENGELDFGNTHLRTEYTPLNR